MMSFGKEFSLESKKLWKIAGPAIFTCLCQYSVEAITQTFAGLVSEIDLAAFAIANNVIGGFAYGIMVSVFRFTIFFFFFWFEIMLKISFSIFPWFWLLSIILIVFVPWILYTGKKWISDRDCKHVHWSQTLFVFCSYFKWS